jgi:hypothetical protein
MLRATQMGLTIRDLEQLTVGFVVGMAIEAANDQEEWTPLATQKEMDML